MSDNDKNQILSPQQSEELNAAISQVEKVGNHLLSLTKHAATPEQAKAILGEDGEYWLNSISRLQTQAAKIRQATGSSPAIADDGSIGSDIAAALRQVKRMQSRFKEMRATAKKQSTKKKIIEVDMDEVEQNKNESKPIPTPPVWKDADEIISSGTLYQKAVIYLNNIDGKRTYHFPSLTQEQNERLKADLYSEENFSDAIVYTRTFNAFLQYGKWMELAQMTYKKEATRLLGLIDMWEGLIDYFNRWEQQAAAALANAPANLEPPFYCLPNWERYHGAQIVLNADGRVTFDEGDFREEIRLQTERTAKALSILKGYIEPLWDYITGEGEPPLWPILPLALESLMEFPDYIPEQNDPEKECYFRFRLRQRRERGETITEKEEATAIIPDYNEIPIDTATEAYAKQLLTDTFYIWEVEKRNKGEKKKKRRYSKE